MKKILSGIVLTLLLTGLLTLAVNIQPVNASGTIYIRADGSIDPPTAPISTADNVTYTFTDNVHDPIVVERDNIVVDGAGYAIQGTGNGTGMSLSKRSNVTIKNMEIKTFAIGIQLRNSTNNIVYGNNVTNNRDGIRLNYGNNTEISENNVTNNGEYGIVLWRSFNNTLSNNNISGNKYNFFIYSKVSLQELINNIDPSNLADGKPVYYLMNQEGLTINPLTFPNIGYLALLNSTNITVENLTLTNNDEGILFAYTRNSIIKNNNITNNQYGIFLSFSLNNTVSGNKVTDNGSGGIVLAIASSNNTVSGNNLTNTSYGIGLGHSSNNNTIFHNNVTNNTNFGIGLDAYSNNNAISHNNVVKNSHGIVLWGSSNNSIYHNNFIENTHQTDIRYSSYDNIWDDGYPSGGNYWSDYNGTDLYRGLYQNETGSDGMGDAPYVIDENNQDNYPLMSPYGKLTGDLNGDRKVDVKDLILFVKAFGSHPSHTRWNANADFNSDGKVDIRDLIALLKNFGKT